MLHQVLEEDIHLDAFPPSYAPNEKTNVMVYTIIQTGNIGKAYTDLTGRFHYRSGRGTIYLFVAYHFNVNAILALPIQNRHAKTITTA